MDKQVRITQAVSWQSMFMLNLVKAMAGEGLSVDDMKLLAEDRLLVGKLADCIADNLLKPHMDTRSFMDLDPEFQLFTSRREVNAAEVRRSMRFFGYKPAKPSDIHRAYNVWHPTKQPIGFFVLEGAVFKYFDRDKVTRFNYDHNKYVSGEAFWLNFFLGKKLIDEFDE